MSTELPSYPELKNLTDREILLLVVERLRSVSINQCNHLRHHWAVTIACLSAGIIGMINLSIAMVVLFFRG